MELAELEERLGPFSRAMYEDGEARVSGVHAMPGHAGFAYGFTVHSGGAEESWFLRLPPPNVKLQGTADVMRQVCVLNALDGGPVPHCSIKWSGEDPQWFGRPFFVVPKLEGDVIRTPLTNWAKAVPDAMRQKMARQAMTALANIHRVDWKRDTPYLGPPIPFEDDVVRWDRFYERAADPHELARVPETRERLLATIPRDAPVGLFHGDFQWSNFFFSFECELLAIVDWELVGVGAILNDVGWVATFNDPDAWTHRNPGTGFMLGAEEIIEMYSEVHGKPLKDLNWYRALAAYKFAIISGFNLSLHRRGKRVDPEWETTAKSMRGLIDRALLLLG